MEKRISMLRWWIHRLSIIHIHNIVLYLHFLENVYKCIYYHFYFLFYAVRISRPLTFSSSTSETQLNKNENTPWYQVNCFSNAWKLIISFASVLIQCSIEVDVFHFHDPLKWILIPTNHNHNNHHNMRILFLWFLLNCLWFIRCFHFVRLWWMDYNKNYFIILCVLDVYNTVWNHNSKYMELLTISLERWKYYCLMIVNNRNIFLDLMKTFLVISLSTSS